MRPIDADKIVYNYSGLAHILPYDFAGIAKYFADQIKAVPTVTHDDLVPHGCWIDKGYDGDWAWKIDGRGLSWRVLECSACGRQSPNRFAYCPNCGAKMANGVSE